MPDGTVFLKERRGYGGESPAMKVGTWRGRRWGAAKGAPRYPREGGKKEGVPALGCAGRRPVPPRSLARAAFRDMCRLAGAAKGRGGLLL
ncbi:hypothetical protein Bwad001_12070 [Bilophila wadsworthia]